MSVLRLALDVRDPVQRARLEHMFRDSFSVRRALQHDARNRSSAYWAAVNERRRDPAATRDRLGLSRSGLEHAAYDHLDRALHLRRFVTKALAMHLADSVWSAAERHLFKDSSGERQGLMHIGRWFDFVRLPGRARSHTDERKWETFRLHGSLDGHRSEYTDRAGRFVQPRSLRGVEANNWWDYRGPLMVVFSGLADGSLVLPVRLPTAPSNQAILDYYLRDSSRWHKIDLVRRRDPNAVGGWHYEAHLLALLEPYASPRVQARRARAAMAAKDRVAGIDVNVSNITVASHVGGRDLTITRIDPDRSARAWSRRDRRRQRELDRSRRSMNRSQYELSKRQEKRARRRLAAGLPTVDVIPKGPRRIASDGRALQRYVNDRLSAGYRRTREALIASNQSATQTRQDLLRDRAKQLVATHGFRLVAEDCKMAGWSKSWGRSNAAFSPSAQLAAIANEAAVVAKMTGLAGGIYRIATTTTGLSRHCPCGARVEKRLSQRSHHCPICGLRGDRDAVSAVLASFTRLTTPDVPRSARVDYDLAREALPEIRRALRSSSGWQDTLSESTDLFARDGSFITWGTSSPDRIEVARRIVGTAPHPNLNELGRRATSERAWSRTNMSRARRVRDTS